MGVLENRRSALSESRIARSIPLATAHCLCFSRFLFLRSFALTSRPTSPPELRRPPRARSVPRPVFVAERDSWLTTSSYFLFFFLLLSIPVKKKSQIFQMFFCLQHLLYLFICYHFHRGGDVFITACLSICLDYTESIVRFIFTKLCGMVGNGPRRSFWCRSRY